MATTTTTISISSNIADNNFAISNTTSLTNAGNDTGMTKTTGLTRIELESSDAVTLVDAGATTRLQTINKGKMFIQNLNERGDGTKYITLLVHAVEIGRLYGGDWMFIPWCAASGKDIEFTASDATETTLEYTCFYE